MPIEHKLKLVMMTFIDIINRCTAAKHNAQQM